MTLEERFWAKVDRRGPDECWPWTGATGSAGYGYIRPGGSADCVLATRVSMALDGRDPGPLEARHTCDNPPCVNPAHLIAGTHLQNMADMAVRFRGGRSTLVEADVRRVRELAAAGQLQRVIAAEYGLTQKAISKIVRRESYRHIPA